MSNKEAVALLEARLAELERKGNALIQVINDLRAEDGLPPRGRSTPGGRRTEPEQASRDLILAEIKPDVFEGKKLQTSVREYLTMRKLRDAGPATPREIYDGLAKGGFKFGAKSEADAFASLRTLLRKRAAFFHKLPNGTYGMTAWYARAKLKTAGPAAEARKGPGKVEAVVKSEGKLAQAAKADVKPTPTAKPEVKVAAAVRVPDKAPAIKAG
jgi:hypothetical protein